MTWSICCDGQRQDPTEKQGQQSTARSERQKATEKSSHQSSARRSSCMRARGSRSMQTAVKHLLGGAATRSDRKAGAAEHCEESTTITDRKVDPQELRKKKLLHAHQRVKSQETRSDCCEASAVRGNDEFRQKVWPAQNCEEATIDRKVAPAELRRKKPLHARERLHNYATIAVKHLL